MCPAKRVWCVVYWYAFSNQYTDYLDQTFAFAAFHTATTAITATVTAT